MLLIRYQMLFIVSLSKITQFSQHANIAAINNIANGYFSHGKYNYRNNCFGNNGLTS